MLLSYLSNNKKYLIDVKLNLTYFDKLQIIKHLGQSSN